MVRVKSGITRHLDAWWHGEDYRQISQPSRLCQFLPKRAMLGIMSTMNISLPDSLKDFVDEQVNQGGYGTSSEYMRELIRKDQDRLQLRGLLLAGARSAQTKPVDGAYFDSLRRNAKAAKRRAAR
jgi:antitoxin ParD1/3/4